MTVHEYRNLSISIIFLSIIFFTDVSSIAVNTENEGKMICIPNATFHIDCNRCKCSPTGMSIDCTDWLCATSQIHYDLLLNVTLECWPGDIFLYNQYKCLCESSGNYASCTSAHYEVAHNLQPTSGSIISLEESVDKCTPGVVFKNKCDTCICGENAVAACLGIGCVINNGRLEAECNDLTDLTPKLCIPQSTFSLDCNQCTCGDDGFSLTCDSYPCLGLEMRHNQLLNITFLCEPESTFLYNQYECLCSGSGKYAVCSLPHYDKTKEFRESNKKVLSIAEFTELCTPGMTFKDLCNICICGSNGKAACTKIDCNLTYDYSRCARNSMVRMPKVRKNEIWKQRKKNSRFCRKHSASMYCRYLRNY